MTLDSSANHHPTDTQPAMALSPWRFCVAPMIDWTDRHERFFLRRMSRHARLYTEMITTSAIIHGDRERLLGYDPSEHPVALQLGGSHPNELAYCAQVGEALGYDEINLNVGCPSDRVQSGRFGACLMAEPQLVAEGIAAMQAAVNVPVTVKCRIGIDDMEDYTDLQHFVDTVATAGCRVFIVHARKAWLQGLSPKENREIPPLKHELVYRLKADFPSLTVVINGGIENLSQCDTHLQHCDGVMLGRAVYHNPYLLAGVDQHLFGSASDFQRRSQVIAELLPYIDAQLDNGVRLSHMTRHILGLFHGLPGGRLFRRHISENAHKPGADSQVLKDAFALVQARNNDI